MDAINNNSPSFGSIQVRLSRMNRRQSALSDRLFSTIKYSDGYQKLAGEDLDIYMLPAKNAGEIEIRYMDPYSGMFVRNERGKILKEILGSGTAAKIEEVADNVIETYRKIVDRIIPTPKEDVSKVVNGKTEMAMINPAKCDNLDDMIYDWKKVGYTQEEAENQAFEEFKWLYHIDNKDADF